MSDINLDFTVDSNDINITVEPNDITFTPTDIQLTVAMATAQAAGTSGQLQYNAGGSFAGVPTTNFNGTTLSLGSTSNVKITGGVNGYVLQTDGTGNLSWTAQSGGGGGNGSPGGANTQIQYNDSGAFGGYAGFTFNETSGDVNMPANLTVVGNISGNVITGQQYISTIATGTAPFVVNSTTPVANLAVGYASNSDVANTVSVSSQPNITSLGSLVSLTVSGTSTIQQAKEKVTITGIGSTGTINFDVLSQAILFNNANASGSFTLNVRGSSGSSLNSIMSTGESFTIMFINTNGATPYILSQLQIDGSNVTPNWLYPSSTPTVGIANSKETYNFNIIKTASATYTVFASRTVYQ